MNQGLIFFHSISESKVSTTSATTATTTFDETTTISGNANVENKTALVAIYKLDLLISRLFSDYRLNTS